MEPENKPERRGTQTPDGTEVNKKRPPNHNRRYPAKKRAKNHGTHNPGEDNAHFETEHRDPAQTDRTLQGNMPPRRPKRNENTPQNANDVENNRNNTADSTVRQHIKKRRHQKPSYRTENVADDAAEKATPSVSSDVLGTEPVAESPMESTENYVADFYEETANTPAKDVPMTEILGVRFKSGGKNYYFAPNGIKASRGTYVIVETARGLEFGEVAVSNTMIPQSDTVSPLKPVVRIATDADIKHNSDNKAKEEEAFRVCNEKIAEHSLDMKLIDAQYTFDNTKLLFYFTSSGRVDFRDLVKDLAGVFRTRIELRQIGIRDEAKLIGGLGICGRPLCCTRFLSDFGQVSIKMAKEQNLSLNSAKISGACGRLMCCLRYEYDTYVSEIKKTPPVDSVVKTPDGVGTVCEISPLAGTVKVRLNDKNDTPPKVFSRDDVTVIDK